MTVTPDEPVVGSGIPAVQLPGNAYAMHMKDSSNASSNWSSYSDSRSSTPEPADVHMRVFDEKSGFMSSGDDEGRNDNDGDALAGVGLLPDEVYERTMSPWRAALRQRILANVQRESRVIASMQVSGFFRIMRRIAPQTEGHLRRQFYFANGGQIRSTIVTTAMPYEIS